MSSDEVAKIVKSAAHDDMVDTKPGRMLPVGNKPMRRLTGGSSVNWHVQEANILLTSQKEPKKKLNLMTSLAVKK